MRRLSRGFTVIELMVSLVVVAILASLALPAFQGTLERTKADTDMGELHRALSSARLEAINRSMSMSVVAVDGDGHTGEQGALAPHLKAQALFAAVADAGPVGVDDKVVGRQAADGVTVAGKF